MKSQLIALLALVSAAAAAGPGNETLELTAPDGVQVAWARRMPDAEKFWKEDLDSTLLAIFDQREGRGIAQLKRWSLGPRLISKIAWSPDSLFLVMTTTSSGGHGPGRYRTFIFSDADGSLRCTEPVTSTVVSADFRFEAPDILVLAVLDPEGKPVAGETYPAKELKVVLHEAFSKMEKEIEPAPAEQGEKENEEEKK